MVICIYILYSVSSSYHDLMPEFLRCVKILCSLYPYYKQALSMMSSSQSSQDSSSQHRRAGSIGSPLDPGRRSPRARSFLNSWAGHRRTGSSDGMIEGGGVPPTTSSSSSGGNIPMFFSYGSGTIELSEDPFDKLETVWSSLESWFDLLLKEVQKLSNAKAGKSEVPDVSTNDTSRLAAAIILSAPPKRREVFLKPSVSFENHKDDKKKAGWRRSWHPDRYVKVTPLNEEEHEGQNMSSLPAYIRSKSSEVVITDDGKPI